MYQTGDEFQRLGHQVEYIFAEQFHCFGLSQIHRYSATYEAWRLVQWKLAQGERFDLVEMHEPLGACYAWQRKRNPTLPPMVVFSYGLEERGNQALIDYRQAKDLPLRRLSRITMALSTRQAAYTVRSADGVVCSNSSDQRYLLDQGVPSSRLLTHYSGADTSSFFSSVNGFRDLGKILFLGQWAERKGILEIVEMVKITKKLGIKLEFTLAGTILDEKEVRQAFPEELQGMVRVIAKLNDGETLRKLYQENGIFLLPSYYEGFPLSLVEASAMSLVPVVTDIAGHQDFIQPGVNGLMTKVGDAMGMAQAIFQLQSNPEFASQLAEGARRTALRHTWEGSARNLLQAYERWAKR
jgi:glycosyltransferase involved in cell wall biosynthesis